ncbi:MAG: long-chain fatty acid--CoA ligase [Syntrophomonadaceae bacterium]|nr:long-chain fatty acid--CoA ligase [Syntrophomonadaceae bacterium]
MVLKAPESYVYQGPRNDLLANFMRDVPSTVHMFYNTVKYCGHRPAQKYTDGNSYFTLTYNEFAERVENFGQGFMALGLQKGDRISIMSGTNPIWDWADYGGRAAGCSVNTIYPDDSSDTIIFTTNHCESSCICVQNEELLQKILRVWEKLPLVKNIVVMNSTYQSGIANVINMQQLWDLGQEFKAQNPNAYQQRWQSITQDDLCTILYTSGTTGQQKGCPLTHKNILSSTLGVSQVAYYGNTGFDYNDTVFSILPLSHNWNRIDNHSACISYGGLIGYAQNPRTLLQDFQEIKPTFVMLVARLWDRIWNGVAGVLCSTPEGKNKYEWAISIGRKVLETRMDENGVVDLTADPTLYLDTALKEEFLQADREVFAFFRGVFGGRVNKAYSGGALLPPDLQKNYWGMNFPLLDGWGLTETASGINMVQARCVRISWEAPQMAGSNMEVMLDPDDNEILVRGDSVIKGYLNNPEDTALSFTADGWFRTGDIGEIDHDFLRIVDRKKAIIVLDTGKNVSPAYIEMKFTNNPYVEQILILGDNRKYVSALVVPMYDNIINIFREKGILFDESKLVYATINSMNTCIEVGEDLAYHPELYKLVDNAIKQINDGLADFESIKKFKIIPRKFTEERGELTPTLKIKNRVVFANYAKEIEELYS